MNRIEYLVAACHAEAWRRLVWRIAVFNVAIFNEDGEPPEPYDLTYIDGLPHFWDVPVEDEDAKWVPIEGCKKDDELFIPEELFELRPDMYPGLEGPVQTSVGRYVFNWIVIFYAFGTRLPYQAISKNPLEYQKEMYRRCLEHEDDEPENDGAIRPSMIGRFVGGLHELAPMTRGIAATGTLRSLTTHPDAYKVRDALLLKHKDELDNPAVIVMIEKALDELDKEWLSGDQSIEFYNSPKSRMRRRKLMLMYGIQTAFKEGSDFTLVPTSLMEVDEGGMKNLVEKFNDTREGSFSRGAETAKGGEQVRIIQMIFQNHRIVAGDCGTKLTHPVVINLGNVTRYIGMNAVVNGKLVQLTEAYLKEQLGKVVRLRRPILCQLGHVDCCAACSSAHKAEEPRAIAADISSAFSNVMTNAMGAMHGRETVVQEFVPLIHIT
ncbi:RNA polymerase beta subunit [Erwinia phage phiEaH2]|uniref:Phage putative RNA polymerase beta subunit 3 n=1 Tax=Erwinia phage phiEaH2 TaxID=1029988 RepID=J7KKV4_9CAUD|nr:RNA polymerase beta subunit [Erwinia phage phiEaH2]AFQ96770.1 phage putative RNA polymerase beta subunit 3 [Erwinia phage phiEaH2]